MARKASHGTRRSSGGRSKPAAKAPSRKRSVAKKATRKATAPVALVRVNGHGATAKRDHGGRSREPVPIAAGRSRFTVVDGAQTPPGFSGFGGLSSTQREAAVRAGLPAGFLDEALAKVGVTRADLLAGVGIASSTAARVRGALGRFSLDDSERLARLARLWHEAFVVYETDEGARSWLTSPIPSAGGVPLSMLATQEGFERAQRSIRQLAYGVFA